MTSGLKAQESGVELVCEIPAALPDIVADKRAVKQILINLMSNAIRFTDRGGSVTGERRHRWTARPDRGRRHRYRHCGRGLGRIGDPFFQARGSYARRHDGTGLGLSIVKGLIKLHGGGFEIGSQPGEGTKIGVRLPLNCEDVSPAAARAPGATMADGFAGAPRRRAAGASGRAQGSSPRRETASQQRA